MTVGTIDPGLPRARTVRSVAVRSNRRTTRAPLAFNLRVAHAARIAGAWSTATQLSGSI